MCLCALKYHSRSVVSSFYHPSHFKYSFQGTVVLVKLFVQTYTHTRTAENVYKCTGFAGRLLLMINVLHSWLFSFHLPISVFFAANEFLVQSGVSECVYVRLVLDQLSNENKKFQNNLTILNIFFFCVIFRLILFFMPVNGQFVLYIFIVCLDNFFFTQVI